MRQREIDKEMDRDQKSEKKWERFVLIEILLINY